MPLGTISRVITSKGANNHDHDESTPCRRLYLGLDAFCSSCLGQEFLLVHCGILPILPKRGTQNASRDRLVPETTGRSRRNTEVLQRSKPPRSDSLWPHPRRCMDGQE